MSYAKVYEKRRADWLEQNFFGKPFSGLGITPSEYDIMQLASLGLTDCEIAVDTNKDASTVKSQLRSVYKKLGNPTTRTNALSRWTLFKVMMTCDPQLRNEFPEIGQFVNELSSSDYRRVLAFINNRNEQFIENAVACISASTQFRPVINLSRRLAL